MSVDRDWREIATEQGTRLLQTRVALHILRAWGGAGEPLSADVIGVVHRWIDGGMVGAVPWPDDPAFRAWAARNGMGEVCGHVGHWLSVSPGSGMAH